jgi:hypothetical protein
LQAHFQNGLRLKVAECEAQHQLLFGNRWAFRGADQLNEFIQMIQRLFRPSRM